MKYVFMKINLKKLTNFFLVFVVMVSATSLVAMESKPEPPQVSASINWNFWENMLLNRPRESLALARETKQEWLKAYGQKCLFQISGLRFLFYFMQCPFFILDECSDPMCGLSRFYGYRESFEDIVSNELIKIIGANPENTAKYIGFGAAGLFSDFLILAKTLEKKPQAKILIIAIDPVYYPKQLLFPLADYCSQQFKTCMQGMFPEATVEIVCIDNSVMDPRQLLEIIQQPDIGVATDINDYTIICGKDAYAYYQCFVEQLVKKYLGTKNFCFGKRAGDDLPAVHSYHAAMAESKESVSVDLLMSQHSN